VNDDLRAALEGEISPQIALARLILAGTPADQLRARLQVAPASPRRAALLALLDQAASGLAPLLPLLAAPQGGLAEIRALFDQAAQCAPQAGVASYSLGDPALLAAATAELVDWLDAQALLDPDGNILDLGCGIGRVAAALAPRVGRVVGLDVSAGMLEAARKLHPELSFIQGNGQNLAVLNADKFDLVLLVDAMPYLVQAGLDTAMLADIAVRLRPGGALAILNWSYRGDPARDRADAEQAARRHGLDLLIAGARPFSLWDASAFLLRRSA
jgi:SAM-dependent methyltransferase